MKNPLIALILLTIPLAAQAEPGGIRAMGSAPPRGRA